MLERWVQVSGLQVDLDFHCPKVPKPD
jgi:hypothetical protein